MINWTAAHRKLSMIGATATKEAVAPADSAAGGRQSAAGTSSRRWRMLTLVAALLVFAGALALGAMVKRRSPARVGSQLAPAMATSVPQPVAITGAVASRAVPALKAAPKLKAKSTSSAAGSSGRSSSSTSAPGSAQPAQTSSTPASTYTAPASTYTAPPQQQTTPAKTTPQNNPPNNPPKLIIGGN
jgi:hypothetical protein